MRGQRTPAPVAQPRRVHSVTSHRTRARRRRAHHSIEIAATGRRHRQRRRRRSRRRRQRRLRQAMLAGFRERSLRRAQPVEVPPPDGGVSLGPRLRAIFSAVSAASACNTASARSMCLCLTRSARARRRPRSSARSAPAAWTALPSSPARRSSTLGAGKPACSACCLGDRAASSAAATRTWHLYLSYGLVCGLGQSLAFFSPT